ncbi:unnamed protein product [Dibothriocephalus latus]|uniref:Uncharacterized protein n=1 Tax=Dibothriocephalus latus TaxID=60516 RepID=A0A3P6V029_DIBLA|nr:unnamed protein product [Dibothriocephalus latus]
MPKLAWARLDATGNSILQLFIGMVFIDASAIFVITKTQSPPLGLVSFVEPGWLYGTNKRTGKSGLFPSNHVKKAD